MKSPQRVPGSTAADRASQQLSEAVAGANLKEDCVDGFASGSRKIDVKHARLVRSGPGQKLSRSDTKVQSTPVAEVLHHELTCDSAVDGNRAEVLTRRVLGSPLLNHVRFARANFVSREDLHVGLLVVPCVHGDILRHAFLVKGSVEDRFVQRDLDRDKEA
jgi:hypothetical protein